MTTITEYILSLDPSGSFHEGKGTTGYCFSKIEGNELTILHHGDISAKDFNTRHEYWKAHETLIESVQEYKPTVVIEDYILYQDKAQSQSNSSLETSRLIGILEYLCNLKQLNYTFQKAAAVKHRWTVDILINKNVLRYDKSRLYVVDTNNYVSRHCIDAIRHGVHYSMLKKKRRG